MKTLIPESVPWAVQASFPKLSMHSFENEQLFVEFMAHFHSASSNPVPVAFSEAQFIDASVSWRVNPEEKSTAYQLICLQFDGVGWVRRSPSVSDYEVIRESDYDWSQIPLLESGETVEAWRRRTLRQWEETDVCPDPGFYTVANSDWDVGLSHREVGLQHYLITGGDSYIEVLAERYKWSSKGNISV